MSPVHWIAAIFGIFISTLAIYMAVVADNYRRRLITMTADIRYLGGVCTQRKVQINRLKQSHRRLRELARHSPEVVSSRDHLEELDVTDDELAWSDSIVQTVELRHLSKR